MLVDVMNRFVWLILLTVFSTLALELTGVAPQLAKDSQNYMETQNPVSEDILHEKEPPHQVPKSEILSNIFKIPIATLTAVSDLVQSIAGGLYSGGATRDRPHIRRALHRHNKGVIEAPPVEGAEAKTTAAAA